MRVSKFFLLIFGLCFVGLVAAYLGGCEKKKIAPLPSAGEVKENSLGMKLVYIPAGEFIMGSPIDEQGRADDEQQHKVKLTRGFWMGATEVTQKQFEPVMGFNRSNFKGEDLPIEKISWRDAETFCKKLSEKEGKVYRLPTEAEWEYACRARATGAFSGTGNLVDMGWYADNSDETTHAVGTKKPNAWELSDMHGNVSEWCFDRYSAAYPQGEVVDPNGAAQGNYRVARGGSWGHFLRACRCASRSSAPESYQLKQTGFRVVMEVSQ